MNIMPVDVRNELIHEKENGIYYKTDHHWTTFGAYQGFKKLCEIMKLDANKVSYDKVTVTNQFKGSLSFKSGFNLGMTELMDIYLPTKNEIHSVVEYVEEKKKTATFYDHKKIGTNNCYELYFDGNHPQITIHNAVDSDRVLLIFKDSYANCFIPFLAPYYKEIVVVDPRYYYDDIEQLISDEEVTDVLFLYNANTFFADGSLKTILKE